MNGVSQHPAELKRVVVTAVGAVTSEGGGAAALWDGVKAGRVAIGPVRGFPMAGYRTSLGGEVAEAACPDYDYLSALGAWDSEPALDFALLAAQEAMAAAGLSVLDDSGPARPGEVPAERWGVAFGSCNGGMRTAERTARRLAGRDSGLRPLDALQLLLVPPHATAEALSAAFGLRGPVLTVNTACASSAHALAHALEVIRAGRADVMLVGGSDAFTEIAFAGFNSVESLSPRPAAPYSKNRDGLSLGEGGGMLVLAEESVARAAGAPILAELAGYGLSADGYHVTAPHPEGEGAARAIRGALESAGRQPEDVGYVNGHGTGTQKNDSAESNAVRAAFGEAADKVALSSTKSMVGHLLGAAGAVEGIVTVLALRNQIAPPTAGFTAADPKCGLDPVAVVARPLVTEAALSNNFAFAGANASVAYALPGTRRTDPVPPSEDRIVITGLGALTAAGQSAEELWHAYRAGTVLGAAEAGLRLARVGSELEQYTSPRERRRMDRLGQFAVAVCRSALTDAGLEADEEVGVVLGTGLGPLRSAEDFLLPTFDGGPSAANPAIFPNTVCNAAAGQVALLLGAKGPTSTATAAHAAGASALCIAYDLLRAGRARAVLCPAVDEFCDSALDAYRGLRLFAGPSGRDYALAEGGVALVVERESSALARGARILAEFAGHGTASDATGIARWDGSGRGVERAMRCAMAEARIESNQLSAVWANAAGLRAVDRPESRALARLGLPEGCRVESPKRVLGEPFGAGAQLSAALAITGWRLGAARPGPVLVNSSSLGSTHISLALRPLLNARTEA
jgi:3-oxoacyl-[acyl-carrier-protein] synthase II